MLISCLSLPRSGSIWYSSYLANVHDATLINEPFNYLLNFKNVDGRTLVLPEYEKDSYWKCPINGVIEKIYAQPTATDKEFAQNKWLEHINFLLKENTVVCKNHIFPMDEKYVDFLRVNSDMVYYTYRENVTQQLASYAIAGHTRQYVTYDQQKSNESSMFDQSIIVDDNKKWLLEFAKMLIDSTKFLRINFPNAIRVKYEDMPFDKTRYGMPYKQNKSSYDRLSYADKVIVSDLAEMINSTYSTQNGQ